ncbi:MAG: Na+/H+ antiporter NhaC family protein [Phascolarctobacterium sp.]|nr:Na+/H+ antiporter NhaC family protein [Phascolarctobacterium sp.]MBR5173101.1 Na+/H+ antiporter NhaC family protein [Phascolarctobacterium sp.]
MSETIWSLVPPLITIALALYTKEVYISLIVGILTGALMFCNFNVISAIDTMFTIMEAKVGGNVNILVFLVLLGILVAAISRSGASKAYGEWAARSIKGKASALFVTSFLGMLIFIDDYFNCLTVGTVMRPVTDKFKVTRAKLAYIIDATAAPICIIAPVSSWAAAVSSSLPEDSKIDGFQLFLQTIPYNYYAWFTLIFLMFLIWSGKDFATMAAFEKKYGTEVLVPAEYQDKEAERIAGKGKIIDLVLPLFVLIAGCIFGMLYTGGILEGAGVAQAFADCNSSKGLVIGSFMALAFTFFLYVPRGVLQFNLFCECFSMGFKAMTPALFILCLAWSLSGICGEEYLNIGGYVSQVVGNNATLGMFLPAMFFLVAIGLAFATGTSWGTFGILIPIVLAVIGDYNELTVVTIAAVLAGAVGGDHVSPISDTTILASAGAQCNHLDHVGTQIPYVLVVSSCCFLAYIVAGVFGSGMTGLFAGLGALVVAMFIVYKKA